MREADYCEKEDYWLWWSRLWWSRLWWSKGCSQISSRQVLAAAGNSLPILSIIMRRNKNCPHHHCHPHFHHYHHFSHTGHNCSFMHHNFHLTDHHCCSYCLNKNWKHYHRRQHSCMYVNRRRKRILCLLVWKNVCNCLMCSCVCVCRHIWRLHQIETGQLYWFPYMCVSSYKVISMVVPHIFILELELEY